MMKRALTWPISVMAVGDTFTCTGLDSRPYGDSRSPGGEIASVRTLLYKRKRLHPGFDYRTRRQPDGTYLVERTA